MKHNRSKESVSSTNIKLRVITAFLDLQGIHYNDKKCCLKRRVLVRRHSTRQNWFKSLKVRLDGRKNKLGQVSKYAAKNDV